MVARHSKQIPIPQSGPRASPLTDCRVGMPGNQNRGCYRCAPRNGDWNVIDQQMERRGLRHVPRSPQIAQADRARRELTAPRLLDDPRVTAPFQAML